MKIIAEIGSNWHTFEDCIKSIERAKECGAHVVKFQLFNPRELHGNTLAEYWHEYSIHGLSPYLNPAWLPELHRHAIVNEIEFMCTGFSTYGYQILNPFVETHKIASAELTDTNILNQVAQFKKPVYLSTAGSEIAEVRLAMLNLKPCSTTIMFCVADYPSRIVDFRHLEKLQETFGPNYSYGFSDHSTDVINLPMKAKDMGCSVIEKHVNLVNAKDTPDAPHSINAEELQIMCRYLMGETPSYDEVWNMTNKQMRSTHKRRFIVTKEIPQGATIEIGKNVEILRSKKASDSPVSTFRHWEAQGKAVNKLKIVGDTISYQDIDQEVL